ncbi:response regulator [Ideonella sp. B7]|uniref:response regulator n=1 Tax=Ideonella benzenivorans TaxID=2831643 RepID=UPI001CEDEC71|nr:response regulator [Ideonella benzenivorans]MCA6215786.1 response regulator [Ideonella benzenivorans]
MNELSARDFPQVMIAEDEPKLAQLLVDYLQAASLSTVVVDDGRAVLPAIQAQAPDLLLLDLMLPGRDGLSICQELRGFSHLPVIMVTARVEEVERLMGLEAGADDYICKPFRPREVVARVQAQLRRRQWDRAGGDPAATAPAEGGRLQLDETRMQALVAGQALDLTPAEFRLLRHLTQTPGRVFSRDQLLDVLHEDGRAVTDRAVDSHVRNLRRKLEGVAGDWEPIRSVYGVGYAWEDAG